MHILKLDTHLDITKENLLDIAEEIGKGFSEGLSPMPWKIIEKDDIIEEFFDELPDHIRDAKKHLSGLSDALDNMNEYLTDLSDELNSISDTINT